MPDQEAKRLRAILVIYTGGTIGMKPSEEGYKPAPGYLPNLVASLPMFHDPDAVPDYKKQLIEYGFDPKMAESPASPKMADELLRSMSDSQDEILSSPMITPPDEEERRHIFRFLDYSPLLDSSNMNYHNWRRIAKDIYTNYDTYDGFVVLHGTDTMAFTASALSFFLENLAKPVVFTGSQIPICQKRNDGLMNLVGAMTLAAFFDIPEVSIYFSSELYRGCRSSKVNAAGLQAFDSPNMKPLVRVGIRYETNFHLLRPKPYRSLELSDHFEQNIMILRIFPGEFLTIETMLSNLKGLVLQTFGGGNAPNNQPKFLATIREAVARGVVIVNVTQCLQGGVDPSYAVGQDLVQAGVITGGDMTPEAALVKLGWLLGNPKLKGRYDEIRRLFQEDLRGEVTKTEQDDALDFNSRGFAKAVYTVMRKAGAFRISNVEHALKQPKMRTSQMIRHPRSRASTKEYADVEGRLSGSRKATDPSSPKSTASTASKRDPSGPDTIQKIHEGLLPTLICQFSATGNVDEVANIFQDYNSYNASVGNSNCGGATAAVGGAAILDVPLLSPVLCDYDGRSGLHLAAANDQTEVLNFFLEIIYVMHGKKWCYDVESHLPIRQSRYCDGPIKPYLEKWKQESGFLGQNFQKSPANKANGSSPGTTTVNGNLALANTVDAEIRSMLNVRDNFTRTPLLEAAEHKSYNAIKILRAAGATLDVEGLASKLCNLAGSNNVECMKAWIAAGANISAGDYDKRTPLHVACSVGNKEMITLLVSAGADENAVDRFGMTPFAEKNCALRQYSSMHDLKNAV